VNSERRAKGEPTTALRSDAEKPAGRQAFFFFPSKFRIPNLENKHAKKDWVIFTIGIAGTGVTSQVTFVRLDSFSTFGARGLKLPKAGLGEGEGLESGAAAEVDCEAAGRVFEEGFEDGALFRYFFIEGEAERFSSEAEIGFGVLELRGEFAEESVRTKSCPGCSKAGAARFPTSQNRDVGHRIRSPPRKGWTLRISRPISMR
jgi:hypothetical protein